MVMRAEFTQTLDWLKPAIDAVIFSGRGWCAITFIKEIIFLLNK